MNHFKNFFAGLIACFCLLNFSVSTVARADEFQQHSAEVSDSKWNSLRSAVQEAKLLPEPIGDGGERSQFGFSVSISGDKALVGAPGVTDAGTVFVLRYDGKNWQTEAELTPSDAEINDHFGHAVSMDGDRALISAINTNGVCSVYVFDYVAGQWSETQKLNTVVSVIDKNFGHSISLSGDRALVGAWSDDEYGPDSGSAFFFENTGGSWSLMQKITSADASEDDRFGYSVSLSGDRALVGAYRNDGINDDSGAAYVFELSAGTWAQTQKLTANDQDAFDNFSFSVSLLDDRALVGAYRDDEASPGAGAAYVFDFNGVLWLQSQKLTASDAQTIDYFGYSVSQSDNRLLVGATRDDDNAIDSGAAYVFENSAGTWVQSQKLSASDGELNDYFGHPIDISGDRVLVGVFEDEDFDSESGAVYSFEFEDTIWSQNQKLTAGDGAAHDRFGRAVSLSGDWALVGAAGDNLNGDNSGSAYVFEYDGVQWSLSQVLTNSDADESDEFGGYVSISGHRAVIGALRDDDNGQDSGSVYVFELSNGGWVESQKLTAGDGFSNDWFGHSVALLSNRIIVGAPFDDDNGSSSGSVYVFELDNGHWVQTQKLIAPDGSAGDYFGYSVSLDSDRLIVGAHRKDDSGSNSGSAYIFEYDGNDWFFGQKLTSDDGESGDQFGISVSLSGNRALVGAYLDDVAHSYSGSAYVFEYAQGNWIQSQKLTPDDPSFGDYFGYAVSMEGNQIVVGSYLDDDNGGNAGAAYVFEYVVDDWSQKEKIIANVGAENDRFGSAVSLSGNRLLVGAYGVDERGTDSGAAYVFDLDPEYAIKVSVTGLAGDTLSLSNGSDHLDVNADGTYSLSELQDGSQFDVDITAQPSMPDQLCDFIDADTGTLSGSDVTIGIECVTVLYDININVTGLLGDGVSFSNGADSLTVTDNGIQTISTLPDGSAYNLVVTDQPEAPNQNCAMSQSGSGSLDGTNVIIDVVCTTEQYTVGVDVSGLASGNALVLLNNGGDELTVMTNGMHVFATSLDDESAYAVTVETQPTSPNQTCGVSNGSGTLAGSGVLNVAVHCVVNQYFIGGTVTGLIPGNMLNLQNNGVDDLTVSSDGLFLFSSPLDDHETYSVTISNQPVNPIQPCLVASESGALNGDDVVDVLVSCEFGSDLIYRHGFDHSPSTINLIEL